MGGEKAATFRAVCGPMGSPPHGRGKVLLEVYDSYTHRITPAWAGKSALRQRLPVAVEDHPRMGGEKTKKIP